MSQMYPEEISPDPIKAATVEMRFTSDLTSEKIPALMFPLLGDNFPLFSSSNIPKEIKDNDPNLVNFPDYVFKNDQFGIGISSKAIIFENLQKYHLWKNFFPVISSTIKSLELANQIKSVQRIGVRYMNLVEDEVFENVIKSSPQINIEGYIPTLNLYKVELKIPGKPFNILLQLSPNANLAVDKRNWVGVYVDIDASFTTEEITLGNVLPIIEELHIESKKLFFSVLSEDYILKLNPKY